MGLDIPSVWRRIKKMSRDEKLCDLLILHSIDYVSFELGCTIYVYTPTVTIIVTLKHD